MSRKPNDRRNCIVYISPYTLINVFVDSDQQYITRIRFKGIPSDYIIDGIQYDYMNDKYAIILYHPSLPIIDVDKPLPVVKCEVEIYAKTNHFPYKPAND